jgi:hypothetical protein
MSKTFKDTNYVHLNKKLMRTVKRNLRQEHSYYFKKPRRYRGIRFNVPSNA